MQKPLKVAVLGVSGIGKHHANWHHISGSEVVAFLGSSASSCAVAKRDLENLFGFVGEGYWDMEELLATAAPDVVDICLPNEQHFEMALKALEAGCHVLCEKPLVWNRDLDAAQHLDLSRRLVEAAQAGNVFLGICTQYAAADAHYRGLYEAEEGVLAHIDSFYAEMETLARGRKRAADVLWTDMGSHPLSLLLHWMPTGRIAPATLKAEFLGRQARVVFDFVTEKDRCHSEIIVRDIDDGLPLRRFGANGFLVDWSGKRDQQGVFCSVLRRDGTESVGQDYMRVLIEQFDQIAASGQGRPLVPGTMGMRNLELQLEIAQAAGAIA